VASLWPIFGYFWRDRQKDILSGRIQGLISVTKSSKKYSKRAISIAAKGAIMWLVCGYFWLYLA